MILNTTNTDVANASVSVSANWSAVGSMAMCVALLIAAEFMPVSLLTPIAQPRNDAGSEVDEVLVRARNVMIRIEHKI